MSATQKRPLNWETSPGVGYEVKRRPDGGMHYTFSDDRPSTLEHWRAFALEHLLDSDRLTTNLYDLRALGDIREEAIQTALEVANDPATRNIRLAVVVANDQVRRVVQEVAALTNPGSLEWGIFTSLEEAEDWLNRPLTLR